MVNVVCRVKKTHDAIIEKFKKHFSLVSWYNLREDVNRIIYASNIKNVDSEGLCNKIKKSADVLNKNAKRTLKRSESIIDLEHLLKEISI